ncbi:MAG: hypothetical protein K0R65_1202 [Crocinitomicaceae bacterium]|jgi:spermidine synthase|nr:hypothetical protein [Crocinitomicaceae bacterium]
MKINEKYILLAGIIAEGFLVTGIEISSSLLFKPYFGSSSEIWTYILGITMLALAAGYFFGSKLSGKNNSERKLVFLFLALSINILLLPFISKGLNRSMLEFDLVGILFLSVSCVLFPPLFLLGAISTLIVKVYKEKFNDSSGKSASVIYTLSTLAGVLSMLLLSFMILPSLAINKVFFLLSVMAALVAVFLLNTYAVKKVLLPFAAAFFIFTIYAFNKGFDKLQDSYSRSVKQEYYNDGLLGNVAVLKDFARRTKLLMVNNSIQTTTDFQDNGNFFHIKDITGYIDQSGVKGNILLAGLGAGSLPKELLKNPGNTIDIVEIDERMIEVCENHFSLRPDKRMSFFVDDARHFINTAPQKKQYKIIILDLSIGETVPSNVYTVEAFRKLNGMLAPDGLIFLNFFTSKDANGMFCLNSIAKTLESAGINTSVIRRENVKSSHSTYVIAGSPSSRYNALNKQLCYELNLKGAKILTDDNSVLEFKHRDVVRFQRSNFITAYQKRFNF